MKKLITSLLVFAGIIFTPQLAVASARSMFNGDFMLANGVASGINYATNVNATQEYIRALKSGALGYGFTTAPVNQYQNQYSNPYTTYNTGGYTFQHNYNYPYYGGGYAPNNYNSGYNTDGYYTPQSNYYFPTYGGYGYTNPYQSVFGNNNMTYMSFRWAVPSNNTTYGGSQNATNVSNLQAQSMYNSSLYDTWSNPYATYNTPSAVTPTNPVNNPLSDGIDGYYAPPANAKQNKPTIPEIDGHYADPTNKLEIDGGF